jgi:hypothetical protein
MPILVNRTRWLSFFALFCVAWFNVVGGPLEAISSLKKTVLHADRLSIPAVKTTERGLMILAGTSAAAGQASAPGQRVLVLVLYSDERLLPANIIMDERHPRGLRGRHQKPR